MKIIFLDIDGVLNSHYDYERYGFDYIDSGLVEILKGIVFATKAEIVLSSTWRLNDSDRAFVRSALRYKMLDFVGITPYLESKPRAEEIKLWLENNPHVIRYAILDDDSDAGLGMEDSFFKTDYYFGLTCKIAENIINYLNK
jgi:hypothetical protein